MPYLFTDHLRSTMGGLRRPHAMKLAEALVLRADSQRRIEQLRERLKLCVRIQEDEKPPEDPQLLLAEADRLLTQLGGLIASINRTNLAATLPDGQTLTDALAQRDVLKLRHSLLSAVANAGSRRTDRYSRSEIRDITIVDVGALRQQADRVAQRHRELDTAIQALNWATELIELAD